MSPRFLFAALLAALSMPACSSAGASQRAPASQHGAAGAAGSLPTVGAAHEMQYTETFEVRFDNDLVGYLVDVLPVPGGVVDRRTYPAGTKLIQGRDFEFLGFISPRGTTYRFDEAGEARSVGVGSVELGIAAFFGKNGPPTLVSISPGVTPGGARPGS